MYTFMLDEPLNRLVGKLNEKKQKQLLIEYSENLEDIVSLVVAASE